MLNFLKSNRTRILVVALGVGLPLQMCSPGNGDDCNCGPITGRFFDINGMEVNNYKKIGDNPSVLITENEAVAYTDYTGLTVEYAVDFISRSKSKWADFSLIQSAYACTCISDGDSGSKNEKLANLTVITLNDFDENHRANDTINDLMVVKGFYNLEDQYLEDYLENDTLNIQFPALNLKVDRKPTLNENYKVKVVVALSTGEVYEKVSQSIKIR